ncbi:MAG: hypothetical protein ACLUE5_06275 [Dysosmobacter sp.]
MGAPDQDTHRRYAPDPAGEDTSAARRLMTELGRVEQYVDMALTYLRLEEGGSDS